MEANNEYFSKVLKLILEENHFKSKKIPEVGENRKCSLGKKFIDESDLWCSVLHHCLREADPSAVRGVYLDCAWEIRGKPEALILEGFWETEQIPTEHLQV